MPLKFSSLLSNGHVETIRPHLFRQPPRPDFSRERLELEDGDFIDLDWLRKGNAKVAVLSHGLEGSSEAKYIRGMSDYLSRRGFDIVAWNCRGCSGETNRLRRMYHSGVSDDLGIVIDSFIHKNIYRNVSLVGFSMGGNITLKYLGEQGTRTHKKINRAVALSTPLHLADCSVALSAGFNKVYTHRFLASLRKKLEIKSKQFDNLDVDFKTLRKLRTLREFDEMITAPFHGFEGADDYYAKCSSYNMLKDIHVPTLILNALNDPFLLGRCYPHDVASGNVHITLECPKFGGHVGFQQKKKLAYWSEQRVHKFLRES